MSEEKLQPIEELIAQRLKKSSELAAAGVVSYPPGRWKPSAMVSDVAAAASTLETGQERRDTVYSLAGRMTLRRTMGKAAFADVADSSGRIQVYVKSNVVGETKYKLASELADIGDIVGVVGHPFRTKTGELTIFVSDFLLLSKSLRPLPEKWHGLKDPEIRYRRRYLDLISTPGAKDIFRKRALIVDSVRESLKKRGYLEVETPAMQTLAGGAAAKPFVTRHNALGTDLYLRIAPELFLKRLLVGGFERVFEIGKNFRNEGIDRQHNPEFTMAEVYCAYADYRDMMDLCEDIVSEAAANLAAAFPSAPPGLSGPKPYTRVNFFDELKTRSGADFRLAIEENRLLETARKSGVDAASDAPPHKILDAAFDKFVVPHLSAPTFVCDFPAQFSPLARPKDSDPFLAERFELFVASQETANAYSELNDPALQKEKFLAQQKKKSAGLDDEAASCDDDYITALEHGMPPAGGLGIGIDRLTMILAGVPSIREVILFPTLKPE